MGPVSASACLAATTGGENMDAETEAKLAKLRTQLEDIEGRKIDASPEQLISLVFPIASHTYLALHQSDNDAWVPSEGSYFHYRSAPIAGFSIPADFRQPARTGSLYFVCVISYAVATVSPSLTSR